MWRSIRALQVVATGGSQPVDMTQLPRRALGHGCASLMEGAGGDSGRGTSPPETTQTELHFPSIPSREGESPSESG